MEKDENILPGFLFDVDADEFGWIVHPPIGPDGKCERCKAYVGDPMRVMMGREKYQPCKCCEEVKNG